MTFGGYVLLRLSATACRRHRGETLGHTSLNTTRGYVAVYEDEVVRHYQTHWLDGVRFVHHTNTVNPPMLSGKTSGSTSGADEWDWVIAIGPTAPTARTNMDVSVARCCASCRLRKRRTAF